MIDRIDHRLGADVLGPEDDAFHVPPNEDWWQIETNWVWFFVPERKLGCWVYHLVRPTIGLDAGSVQIWDDTAWHHTEVPYHRSSTSGRLAEGADLCDHTFTTGFRWTGAERRARRVVRDPRCCAPGNPRHPGDDDVRARTERSRDLRPARLRAPRVGRARAPVVPTKRSRDGGDT